MLQERFKIKGFPTIKLFPSERTNKAPFKKEQDYQGERSAAAIVQFATSKLPSFVKSLNSANFDTVFAESSLAKVLLFSDKPTTTTLYKGLSVEFKDRLVLTEVKKSDKDLVAKYKVTSFPTLLVLKSADAEPVIYEGKLNADALLTFLRPFAPAKSTGGSSSPSPPPQETGPTKAEIHRVNSQADLEKVCLSQNVACVITAVDETNSEPGEVSAQVATMLAVAEKNNLFKRFAFVVVDGFKQSGLQKHFNLYSGFPAVVVYHPKKKVSANYIGAFDVEHIKEHLEDVLVGKKRLYPDNGVPALVNE